jgi:hypothetical protein
VRYLRTSGGVLVSTEAAASRFHREHSIIGIFAGIVSVVVVGFVCDAAGVPPMVRGAAAVSAFGLPAAIEYTIQARRRDKTADAARIRRGELRRPIGLVVIMFAAAFAVVLFLVDSIIGRIFAIAMADGYAISHSTAIVVTSFAVLIVGVAGFFISSYASHYLGKKAYLWTAVTVGVVFVFRVLFVFGEYGVGTLEEYGILVPVLFRLLVAPPIYLGACLAGTWYGRRHHDEFLANKLLRMQRNASRANATQQPSSTVNQTTPTDLLVPDDIASHQPSHASGLDLVELLKKLGDLRDAGVLTEEEFQAKKTEILARL